MYLFKASVEFMKKINPPLPATHNGPCTSICMISTKLVVHSSLAYEQSFSHPLEEDLTSVISFQNKIDSKSPSTWSSFMFYFSNIN